MVSRIVIIGGGPAGYEAALVAAQLGAEVTIVERDGLGGSCVLYDCVPSKTLIASSTVMTSFAAAAELGIDTARRGEVFADARAVEGRVTGLALAQSADVAQSVRTAGVRTVLGSACLLEPDFAGGGAAASRVHRVRVDAGDGAASVLECDTVLLATGATPRILAGAEPDGERILTWRDLYDLTELPEHLVVVGSGVTGAEFASAYLALGSRVTLVSSRDRVMPQEDPDAAELLESVFARRGMTIEANARADGAERTDDGVAVRLTDGRTITGSHVLMAVGSTPNVEGLGLDAAGAALTDSGHVSVDRVSRTSAPGIYAAGDVTGVLMLASVAAMQGRIAMWHTLGEAVSPLRRSTVSANVFTDPEVARVGVAQSAVDSGRVSARVVKVPLATNPRAKMEGIYDGFVKLFASPGAGTVVGGVVVAPRASELILPITLAVQNHLSVDQVAHTFSIYPSLSGSVTETARKLMQHTED